MYLNRFDFEISNNWKSISKSDKKHFGIASNHFEELLFYYLPKKTNLGGYGYFTIMVGPLLDNEDEINAFGQIMEYRADVDSIISFLGNDFDTRFLSFVDLAESALKRIELKYEIDTQYFNDAFTSLRKYGPNLEYPLKVSKWHKNRKIKVEFIRIVKPLGEKILFRVLNK